MAARKQQPAPETVSLKVAAERLGIHPVTAYRLAANGQLGVPVIRLGSRVLIPLEPLERLLRDGNVPQAPSDERGAAA